eukprot:EG_transcript_10632
MVCQPIHGAARRHWATVGNDDVPRLGHRPRRLVWLVAVSGTVLATAVVALSSFSDTARRQLFLPTAATARPLSMGSHVQALGSELGTATISATDVAPPQTQLLRVKRDKDGYTFTYGIPKPDPVGAAIQKVTRSTVHSILSLGSALHAVLAALGALAVAVAVRLLPRRTPEAVLLASPAVAAGQSAATPSPEAEQRAQKALRLRLAAERQVLEVRQAAIVARQEEERRHAAEAAAQQVEAERRWLAETQARLGGERQALAQRQAVITAWRAAETRQEAEAAWYLARHAQLSRELRELAHRQAAIDAWKEAEAWEAEEAVSRRRHELLAERRALEEAEWGTASGLQIVRVKREGDVFFFEFGVQEEIPVESSDSTALDGALAESSSPEALQPALAEATVVGDSGEGGGLAGRRWPSWPLLDLFLRRTAGAQPALAQV